MTECEVFTKHKMFLLTRIGELHALVGETQKRFEQLQGAIQECNYHLSLCEAQMQVVCVPQEEVEEVKVDGEVIETVLPDA